MSVFKSACRVGQSVAGPLVKAKLPIVLCSCVLSASVEYMLVRSSSTPSAVGTQTSARANFNHTTSHSAVCASASVPHQLHPFSKNMCGAYSPHHHPSRFARLFPSPAFQLSGSLGSDSSQLACELHWQSLCCRCYSALAEAAAEWHPCLSTFRVSWK